MDKHLIDPPVTADEAEQVCTMSIGFCTLAEWWGNEDESIRFYGMVSLFDPIRQYLVVIEAMLQAEARQQSCNVFARIGNN